MSSKLKHVVVFLNCVISVSGKKHKKNKKKTNKHVLPFPPGTTVLRIQPGNILKYMYTKQMDCFLPNSVSKNEYFGDKLFV